MARLEYLLAAKRSRKIVEDNFKIFAKRVVLKEDSRDKIRMLAKREALCVMDEKVDNF